MPNYDDYQWQVNNNTQPLPSWVQPLIANQPIIADQPPIAVQPIPIEGTPADRAAYTVARGVTHSFKQPVTDDRGHPFGAINPERPSYIMEPDLQETQGGLQLPLGMVYDDAGRFYYQDQPNQQIPMVKRPGLLPLAMSPEGLKVVMPKMLDIASNVMGNVGGKVAVKGGEMVLGSGLVRPTIEAAKSAEPLYSQLERTVQQSKINLTTPEQWLGYLQNKGVKKEEIATVLGQLSKEGMLSKAQLEDYVKQNKVEVKEKVLGDNKSKTFGDLEKEYLDKGYDINTASELAQSDLEMLDNIKKIDTKYHQYQLPGGENYKETLLSLPENSQKKALIDENNKFRERRDEIDKTLSKKGNILSNDEVLKLAKEKVDLYDKQKELARKLDAVENTDYKAPHFNEHGTNLIGHLRTNERMIGNKVGTHIEEIQSDWGQGIRKHGYKGEKEKLQPEFDKIEKKIIDSNDETIMGQPKIEDALKMAVERGTITKSEADVYKRYTDIENGKPLPDMPFKKNWDEMLLKRAIHDAAVKGHDFISWTPGEAQAARYDLSKQIKNLSFHTDKEGQGTLLGYDHSGKTVLNKEIENASKELPDIVGKEVAEKLLNQQRKDQRGTNRKIQRLENADLKIGGEGMKAFYDKMLVDRANSIGKKYGSKVEQKFIPSAENFHEETRTKRYKQPIHYMEITPELRQKAKEGFSLFSSSPTLTPVTQAPQFDSQEKSKYKLVPVDQPPVF